MHHKMFLFPELLENCSLVKLNTSCMCTIILSKRDMILLWSVWFSAELVGKTI
jgi:hypothetical protein